MDPRAIFIGETHDFSGPQISIGDYDPHFRSMWSDARFITAQEIGACLRGELGPGEFRIIRWK